MFQQELVIDLITTNVEIGELAKLGASFGYEVHVEKAWKAEFGHYQVRYSCGPRERTTSALVN